MLTIYGMQLFLPRTKINRAGRCEGKTGLEARDLLLTGGPWVRPNPGWKHLWRVPLVGEAQRLAPPARSMTSPTREPLLKETMDWGERGHPKTGERATTLPKRPGEGMLEIGGASDSLRSCSIAKRLAGAPGCGSWEIQGPSHWTQWCTGRTSHWTQWSGSVLLPLQQWGDHPQPGGSPRGG